MRIFVLEDDVERLKRFGRALIGHVVAYASDVDDAIQTVLKEPAFDLYFLDHALCAAHYGGYVTSEPTGQDFARYVARELSTEKRPVLAVVHSLNTVGAYAMEKWLTEAGIVTRLTPFVQFDKMLSWVSVTERALLKRAAKRNDT